MQKIKLIIKKNYGEGKKTLCRVFKLMFQQRFRMRQGLMICFKVKNVIKNNIINNKA